MEGFKEFQGKDLDSAIEEACGYFNTAREKLEIEILQDAKSGIFGIVGARKAKVRARRAHLREAVESILGKKGAAAPDEEGESAGAAPRIPEKNARQERPRRGREQSQERGRKNAASIAAEEPCARAATPPEPGAAPAGEMEERAQAAPSIRSAPEPEVGARADVAPAGDENRPEGQSEEREAACAADRDEARAETRAGGRRESCRASGRARPRREESRPGSQEGTPGEGLDLSGEDLDEAGEGLPVTPVEQLDAVRLEALVQEAVRELVRPIVGTEMCLDVKVGEGRVQVCVDCDEDSGLLIGREGQTLAALQYLVSRVVSRGMNAAVRVQLDAGEYRRRQDEKLREMALALAERVRQSGRSYSTRPLSSYHRRIVHVCLQDAGDVQTRSTGDGPMKRVVIMRRKLEKA